jgi:N-acetylmuramoyl-L-alanine amidase
MDKAGWFSEPRRSNSIRRALLATGFILAAGVCPAQDNPDAAKVTAVRFWSLGDVTRIAVEVSSDFTFKYNRLANPDRLFFDIYNASPAMVNRGVHTIPVGDALVSQIRVAETQPEVTRVVLDLAQPASFTTSQLSNPNRLMIELRSKDRPLPPSTPSISGGSDLTQPANQEEVRSVLAERTPTPKREPRKFIAPPVLSRSASVQAVPQLPAPPKIAALAKPARLPAAVSATTSSLPRELPPPPVEVASITPPEPAKTAPPAVKEPVVPVKAPTPARRGARSLTRALGLKLSRVVLDAGHGGHDVGTHGPSGYLEKDLTLDVTQRLGALIEERMGSEVIYTRSDDTYVPLEERTKIANEAKADLFLSIHANSSSYRAAAGAETFVLNFTTSRSAMELAARENDTA